MSARVCISSCLSAPLQGFVGLSIRVKGLLWNRSLFRVYDDPPEMKMQMHTRIRVCACTAKNRRFGQKWHLCLPSCFCVDDSLKCTKASGACMCVKLCVEALVCHRPEQSLAKQIPSCLYKESRSAAFLPASLHADAPLLASLDALQSPPHDLDQHLSLWVLSFSGLFEFSYPPLPSRQREYNLIPDIVHASHLVRLIGREQNVIHRVCQH